MPTVINYCDKSSCLDLVFLITFGLVNILNKESTSKIIKLMHFNIGARMWFKQHLLGVTNLQDYILMLEISDA